MKRKTWTGGAELDGDLARLGESNAKTDREKKGGVELASSFVMRIALNVQRPQRREERERRCVGESRPLTLQNKDFTAKLGSVGNHTASFTHLALNFCVDWIATRNLEFNEGVRSVAPCARASARFRNLVRTNTRPLTARHCGFGSLETKCVHVAAVVPGLGQLYALNASWCRPLKVLRPRSNLA